MNHKTPWLDDAWEIVAFKGPTTEDYENLRADTHAVLFCLDYVPDTRRVAKLEGLIVEAAEPLVVAGRFYASSAIRYGAVKKLRAEATRIRRGK